MSIVETLQRPAEANGFARIRASQRIVIGENIELVVIAVDERT